MEPTPGSCALCSRPLLANSVDGLCWGCVRTQRLPRQPGDTLRPAATDGPVAHLHFAHEVDAEVPLPPNPPGLALLRRLGAGGMGTVYLGVDGQTRRLMAVKLLHAPGDRASVERFQAEVRALAELDHPHIVRVFAAELRHHSPYYTMEYVPGGTLARRVGTCGPLPPRDAVALLVPVARAAHAAHERGIVHRDIKPGNVLLSHTGAGMQEAELNTADAACLDSAPRAKLSDFGLAKRTDRNDGLTVGPAVVGTPGFMAPEQASGGAITPRTDVYGLGATLFYALTGRAPCEGRAHAEPPRVRSLNPVVPSELEAVVHMCLETDPAARYASAAELVADLERFGAGEPVRAKPLTPVRLAARAVVRNRRPLARLTLALAALALAVLGGAALNDRPRSEQPRLAPLEEMKAKLAAGKPVTLIGATGEPAWHRWAQGAGGFGAAGNCDQACAFQALEVTMLDLCPDPMTDRYRIRAELCQLDVFGRAQDGQLPTGGVHEFGLYFGRQSLAGNNGRRGENCFAVRFSEVLKASGPEQAKFGRAMVVDSPTRQPGVSGWGLANVPLAQSGVLPGPWRVIEVEVGPQGVKAWMGSLEGAPLAFPELGAARLGRCYAQKSTALDEVDPHHGLAFPAWKPRAALGVWSYRSAVAFRNVTLTPLK
jgi:hypothetical protein